MAVKFEHVLVTGGAGYCGSVLVPQMLDMGYRVTVYDIQYYGYKFLPLDNTNLTVIQGDIRDIEKLEPLMTDVNIVLHLACISNEGKWRSHAEFIFCLCNFVYFVIAKEHTQHGKRPVSLSDFA